MSLQLANAFMGRTDHQLSWKKMNCAVRHPSNYRFVWLEWDDRNDDSISTGKFRWIEINQLFQFCNLIEFLACIQNRKIPSNLVAKFYICRMLESFGILNFCFVIWLIHNELCCPWQPTSIKLNPKFSSEFIHQN